MPLPRLSVTTSDHNGATLVHVDGEIDLLTAPQLERELTEATDKANDLIVDLRDVEFMDSTGVGVLVRTSRKFTSESSMHLICGPGPVRRVIDVSGLSSFINVVEDLDSTSPA